MLILRDAELRELLTVEETIDALKAMLAEQAQGGIRMPERVTADIERGGFLRVMPAIHNRGGFMGFKFMDVVPGHGARYAIALFETATGAMTALVDADYVTMIRTSATAAIATDLIGPREVEAMGLLGSSAQAEGLILALAAVRAIPRVRVFSPNEERRRRFAERLTERTGIAVEPVGSPAEALRGANLICGAYRATGTPSIGLGDLRAGAHINSLSSVRAQAREVADEVWGACSQIILDHREGVAASGDGLSVTRGGLFDLNGAPELWESLRDRETRGRPEAITMFKSVGAATQDLAVAERAYRLALERGAGEEAGEFPALRVHN